MIKVSLFGKNSDSIRHLLPMFVLQLVDDKPDVIISYGGDGTLLSAERKFPGIPKLPIRDSKVCKKCSFHSTETLLEFLGQRRLNFQDFPKLEAKFESYDILAINDIVIRNSTPMHALRFRVLKNNEPVKPDVFIGDGIVATTPFGSTGYYQSITRQTLNEGFAIAFNNTTLQIEPLKFTFEDEIKMIVVRGPGSLSSDNSSKILFLKEGDEVRIFASTAKARIFMDTLRCNNCVILRDKRLR
ncbi:hypothetical protein HYW44_02925 [Candidatus Daviesbacteria bacterium]|nr:hypothetical protein [Candidatus Daviesbacteria bacterium]